MRTSLRNQAGELSSNRRRVSEARITSEMVRYANRSRIEANVPKGSTPCVTHHFPAGSLHAPYRPRNS